MPTIDPILSVLIPCVRSRVATSALMLFDKLMGQAVSCPDKVELLLLLDNKARSVGLKREALMQSSRGKFVAFVDDDDDVADSYIARIVEAAEAHPDADCIVFDQSCTLNNSPPVIVKHGIEFENTEIRLDGGTRKPWHVMAYRGDLARSCRFPDASYGEDWYWVDQAWQKVKKQHRIEEVLHHYRFSQSGTEAEIVYPDRKPE